MDKGDYDAAEAALKAVLTADVMFGPAHNNLGKVYFHKGELYLAAREFDYAMKLMPNQPEPANNLGLVFETRGRLDDAVSAYGKAAALEPDNVQIMGNWARARVARVRRGERDPDLVALLNKLVARRPARNGSPGSSGNCSANRRSRRPKPGATLPVDNSVLQTIRRRRYVQASAGLSASYQKELT